MATSPRYAKLGTVSHGTMETGDLLDTFARELDYQLKRQPKRFARAQYRKLIHAAGKSLRLLREDYDRAVCDADAVVADLLDTLSDFAPPYAYFGAHEGDGACFGFWPNTGTAEEAARDGFAATGDNLSDIPAGYAGDVVLTNDHGNMTVGHLTKGGKFHEYWSWA